MGIEEMKLGPGTFYITDPETGKMQEFDAEIREVDLVVLDEQAPECLRIPKSREVTINVDCPWNVVQYGKLSRKRFVKLLMSEGRSRNHANALARSWREKTRGAPYYLEAIARSHYWGYKVRIGNCRIV